MTPELKRAIIKFVPDYFSWDTTRQEQYRVNIPEEDAFKIQQYLLKELFNITVSGDDEKEDVWDRMTVEQCTKINATILPLKGIGEDCFYLMVAGYIYSKLDEYGNEYIEKLIPHEFKQGKNHGKAVSSGYLYDMQVDAKGLELQLEDLRHRFWKHLDEAYDKLVDEFDRKSNQYVFILDQSKPGDPCHHFLFSDQEILKHIHFKTFMRDCRAYEQTDHALLLQKLEEEKMFLTKYLDTQYKDIIENFNPKIVKFKKKRKVIFHKDSGFDKLF